MAGLRLVTCLCLVVIQGIIRIVRAFRASTVALECAVRKLPVLGGVEGTLMFLIDFLALALRVRCVTFLGIVFLERLVMFLSISNQGANFLKRYIGDVTATNGGMVVFIIRVGGVK